MNDAVETLRVGLLRQHKISGPELAEAMRKAGVTKKDLAELLEVSLKTVYNLVKMAELRGPYRWAAYTLFPGLGPSDRVANSPTDNDAGQGETGQVVEGAPRQAQAQGRQDQAV